MQRIGIIADTHGLLREEVLMHLETCDMIFHAGDCNCQEVVERLKQIAPLYVVKGNNDRGQWAETLPTVLQVTAQGKKFLICHIKKDVPKDLTGIDFVIYGHSHQYHEEQVGHAYWLNPGSCGPRRFGKMATMAILTLEDASWQVTPITLEA